MRNALLILLFSILFVPANAQDRGIVKGFVLDSLEKTPIQFTTVAVLRIKDSSLVAYTITDKGGRHGPNGVLRRPN